jgi:nitrilase
VLIRGGSCIVSPLGDVLAGPCFNEAAVLTADLDLDVIARGKYDFDVVGHYARPDLFQLHVNTAKQRPVAFD